MALTAEWWLDFLGDDTYIIAIFRKPDLVAGSLLRRQQQASKQAGVEQAQAYARRIIRAIEKFMRI